MTEKTPIQPYYDLEAKPDPVSETLVSDCCGSHEQCTSDGNPLYDSDTGICAACKDHTTFITESEYYA